MVLGYGDHVCTMHLKVLHMRRITRAALAINFLARRVNFLQVALV